MTDSRVPDLAGVASPPRRELSYGDLEPEEPIGSGGQAVVRVARIVGSESPERVALREPTTGDETLEPAEIESFFDSVSTWQRLDDHERRKPRWADSEFVVGIVDTGEQFPWVAMELMDGGSLADRLAAADGGLALAEALWIAECVARGLELAHSVGVAHLDLKPENVLFRSTPAGAWDVPKIADWGLAETLIDTAGDVEGFSPAYAAPEQFDTDYGEPDTLTDVYQVGLLLYALLTGAPPNTGSYNEVATAVLSGEAPDPPSASRADVPEAVDRIVARALAPDKTDRYRSIGRLVDLLGAAREELDEPPAETPDTDSQWDSTNAGADLRTRLALDLAAVYRGATRELQIRRPTACSTCDATGCRDCGGTGLVTAESTVTVDVPPGVEDGQTLRLPGEGVPDPEGEAGDLLVEVSVRDHPELDRYGTDLAYVVTEYRPGGEITVPTVESSVDVQVPENVEPGEQLRLEGEGMPKLRERGYGDLYVQFG